MGMLMTASEANRQRILTLLLFEREMSDESDKLYKESSAMKLGQRSAPEIRQLSTADRFCSSQQNAS